MGFQLEAYKAGIDRVRTDDIDFGDFARRPLSAEALRSLHYMSDIETHTVCYLRDLLVTPSHQDPRITTFLTMWNYEEYFHGEVIDEILAAHGEETGDYRVRRFRKGQGVKNVIVPITQCLSAAAVGEAFIATHMSWGAINEWSTWAGYDRLIAREQHPTLATLLKRIMRQETRHIGFYASEARRRLAASKRAQRVTRFALRHFWTPVGSAVMPFAETAFLLDYLLGGAAGANTIAHIDRNIDKLPGLAGLDLLRSKTARYGITAPTSA